MKSLRQLVAMTLALTAMTTAWSQAPPSVKVPAIAGGFPDFQVIPDVPAFHEQELALVGIPKATGPRLQLFNGVDLSGFTPWLGYSNGTMFPTDNNDKPLGETGIGDVFKVVQEEGKPAIYIFGRIWGSINTKRDVGNYHLSLNYKFGRQLHPDVPLNSGVLYHSYGPYGAFAGTWMSSAEFEVAKGLTGMIATIGKDMRAEVEIGEFPGPGLFGGKDFRFMPGGKRVTIRLPTMVKQQRDVERPQGQWNTLDLYVAGDRAVHVVNGVPTMALFKITREDEHGVAHPLTHGRIQLESEGSEVFMRDLWIEPIHRVPRVVVRKEHLH